MDLIHLRRWRRGLNENGGKWERKGEGIRVGGGGWGGGRLYMGKRWDRREMGGGDEENERNEGRPSGDGR
jgi:hypothetical protein